MPRRILSAALASLAAICLAIAPRVQAQSAISATFTPTSGTPNYDDGANWSGGVYPTGAGASATFSSPTAAETVNINTAITLGTLNTTNTGSSPLTFATGTAGSLIFDTGTTGGQATFTIAGTNPSNNTVSVTADVVLSQSLNLNVTNTALTGTAATSAFSGNISGAGDFIKNGAGSTSFTTAVKTYTGATVINNGFLRVTGNGTITSTSSVTVNSGGQLRIDSGNPTVNGSLAPFALGTGTITLNGTGVASPSSGGALRMNAGTATTPVSATISNAITVGTSGATIVTVTGGTLQLDGVIGGTGRLTKGSGGGTLVLTADNTYSGNTSITGGTLQIGGGTASTGGTTGSVIGNVSAASGTTLAFNRSDALSYGGVVSGTGSVAVQGGGTVTLTGANTYTGTTRVGTVGGVGGAGTILVNGSLANTATTLGIGGTLGGSGSVAGGGDGRQRRGHRPPGRPGSAP